MNNKPELDGVMPEQEVVAEWLFDSFGWNMGEARQHAKLFAAAPQLLEALQEAYVLLESYSQGDHTGRPWLKKIESAIEAATE